MANNIPEYIKRDHILKAIERFDDGAEHLFAESITYDVLYNGRRYPPKAIIGMAAEVLTGKKYGPSDFKGGQDSMCFRILQQNGFQIVTKEDNESKIAWIFQGNPIRFDIDDYLNRYTYIYWSAPKQRAQMQIGAPCIIWRAGSLAGAVAIGRIAEAPKMLSKVNFPECMGDDLWTAKQDEPSTYKVGIELDEVRLDEEAGCIPRSVFLSNPQLQNSLIIRSPQGTVFRLEEAEAKAVFSLWGAPLNYSPTVQPAAMEGSRQLKKHYARERSRKLIDDKKKDFALNHDGKVYCEVCEFDFSDFYPSELGNGFIEAHHLAPLFSDTQPRRTTFDDLMLVCSNCHRMIHRTKDVDHNLAALRQHFATQSC